MKTEVRANGGVWTKKNVARMYTDELVHFYNATVTTLQGYAKYEMEVPASTTKRYEVIRAELIKRGTIKSAN